ncbi:MAG: cytochrome b/b6 domain-containing protein, partial [Aestuariivirga sp.]
MNVAEQRYTPDETGDAPARPVKVWDLPVRLFHWLLVACVGAAAVTGWLLPVTWLQVHLIAGTVIAGLVLGRTVWGFTGSRYSRFRSFMFSPESTLAHVKDLMEGRVQREAGHNPLGALMVFALLGCISLLVVTGVMALGGVFKQGPLKTFISFATAATTRDVHSVVAWILLALIGGHVAGVVFESWRTRENLAAAMVTGSKRSGFAHEAPMAWPRSGVALLVSALLAV